MPMRLELQGPIGAVPAAATGAGSQRMQGTSCPTAASGRTRDAIGAPPPAGPKARGTVRFYLEEGPRPRGSVAACSQDVEITRPSSAFPVGRNGGSTSSPCEREGSWERYPDINAAPCTPKIRPKPKPMPERSQHKSKRNFTSRPDDLPACRDMTEVFESDVDPKFEDDSVDPAPLAPASWKRPLAGSHSQVPSKRLCRAIDLGAGGPDAQTIRHPVAAPESARDEELDREPSPLSRALRPKPSRTTLPIFRTPSRPGGVIGVAVASADSKPAHINGCLAEASEVAYSSTDKQPRERERELSPLSRATKQMLPSGTDSKALARRACRAITASQPTDTGRERQQRQQRRDLDHGGMDRGISTIDFRGIVSECISRTSSSIADGKCTLLTSCQLAFESKSLLKLCAVAALVSIPETVLFELMNQFTFENLGMMGVAVSRDERSFVTACNVFATQISLLVGSYSVGLLSQQLSSLQLLRWLIPACAVLQSFPAVERLAPQAWVVVLSAVALGLSIVVLSPLQALVPHFSPAGRVGEALGTFGSSKCIASLMGNAIISVGIPAIQSTGLEKPLWVLFPACGLISLCALPVALVLSEPHIVREEARPGSMHVV
mmetsp:Transcript_79663/g.206961  ORF Transcript_79663/g.206961 Transcript_79663/m.206961 type:complete len:608 (-) Transcript_79663:598-2421(-)